MHIRHSLVLLAVVIGCRDGQRPVDSAAAAPAAPAPKGPPAINVALYADSAFPAGPLGESVRRGKALIEHTPDSLPAYAGGNLRCTSCHLDGGLRANAAPLVGVISRFPKYLDRSGAVIPVEDRVNYCFTRSLAGRALPTRSREMVDIVAYLAFISRGAGAGGHVAGEGMPKMTALAADSGRGRVLYAENCARCHGADGAGVAVVPALWGAKSFSVGASMARVERAASFIRHNMPFDKPGTLTDQQAFDLAAFVDAHPRPDSPGKELDWPKGGAPDDVPYVTTGRTPATITPVLPRKREGAIVPVPAPAAGKSAQ